MSFIIIEDDIVIVGLCSSVLNCNNMKLEDYVTPHGLLVPDDIFSGTLVEYLLLPPEEAAEYDMGVLTSNHYGALLSGDGKLHTVNGLCKSDMEQGNGTLPHMKTYIPTKNYCRFAIADHTLAYQHARLLTKGPIAAIELLNKVVIGENQYAIYEKATLLKTITEISNKQKALFASE